MTHDYLAAITELNKYGLIDSNGNTVFASVSYADAGDFVAKYYLVLRHALLVADRLMREPSEGMIEAGLQEDNSHPDCFASHAELFKAMRSAMLAEIDGGVV
jgi:superfamily II helicase